MIKTFEEFENQDKALQRKKEELKKQTKELKRQKFRLIMDELKRKQLQLQTKFDKSNATTTKPK